MKFQLLPPKYNFSFSETFTHYHTAIIFNSLEPPFFHFLPIFLSFLSFLFVLVLSLPLPLPSPSPFSSSPPLPLLFFLSLSLLPLSPPLSPSLPSLFLLFHFSPSFSSSSFSSSFFFFPSSFPFYFPLHSLPPFFLYISLLQFLGLGE